VPLVDRVPERRHLWRALAQTAVERRARLVVLRGPAGCGKSRLAAWLVERAHEGGHAIGLRALHGPIASAGDGAGPMLARHFGVSGAPLEAPIRLSAVLAELGIAPAEISAASDELLAWSEGRPGAAARPAAERWEIATRALTRLAARRPAVLWLDDVHWGAGTLALTQHLLDAQATAPAPILIVATVRDDALAERAVEGALLGALSERAEASTLALGALPEPDRGTLVRALLGLDAELAARVEERTAGNPAFTVELVADWTRRGLLVHGPSGFRLREGVSVGLPADLASTWTEILEHVLADRPPGDAIALEVAAAFGGVGVVPAEWARACETVSGTPSLDLLDVLASRGLVSRATPGAPFSLVHGMLREALEARAHAAGRARAQHHAWAVVLAGGAEGSVDRQEQLGRHLLAAGDAVGAALRLVPAIAGRVDAGEASRAYALAVDTESALGPAGPAETCEAARVLRADAARLLGRYEEAATLSEEIAAATSDARTRAHALLVRGVVARERGEPKVALAHWRDGLRIARSVPDPGRAAQLARWIGVALTDLGDLAGAEESFEEALRDAPEGDHGLRANVEIAHAAVLRLANRLPEAEQVLERARAHAERVGRGPMASARNALGELSRWRGRFEAAERHYEAAAALYDAVGSRSTAVARLNLGLTRIESGRPLEAETPLRSCLETARRQGRRGLVAMALGGLMAPAAARRDWTAWEETQHALVAEVAAIHLVEIDLARALARAAELATAAGEGLRALPVFELAIAQLAALGREDEAAPLRLVVDGLKSC
jgi:tetratricopeptide (TPR) repeat protein